MTIITDAASNATKATGIIVFGTPIDLDFVAIGGIAFTYRDVAGGYNEFHTIAELTALINALANVDATDDGSIVTITAATAGEAGNDITIIGDWNTSLYPGHLVGGSDAQLVTDLTGDWLLSTGKRDEAIDEQTLGGFMQLQDVTLEIHDRNHLFRDEIFNRDITTKAQAVLVIKQNGTDEEFLYGDVDLDTVQYPLYYAEDAVHAEGDETSCKFTVYSFLKRLETHAPSDLRPYLDSRKVFGRYIYSNAGVTYYKGNFVKLTDAFDAFVSLLGVSFDPVAFTCVQRFKNWNSSDIGLGPAFPTQTWHTFDELWILYDLTGASDETISGDWFKDNPASGLGLMNLRDCKAIIEQLCMMFFMYPLLVYYPTAGKFQLKLVQRTQSSAVTLGPTTEQVETVFRGYDGIRVTVSQNGTGITNNYRDIYPANLSDTNFDVVEQKLDLYCQIRLAGNDGIQTFSTWNNLVVRSTVGGYTDVVAPIRAVKDEDGTEYTGRYTKFLLARFVQLWGKSTRMFKRTVIGTDFVNLRLGKVSQIGLDWYTISKLTRDVVTDLAEVELIQYPLPGFVPEFESGGTLNRPSENTIVNYSGVQLVNAGSQPLYSG